MIRASSAGKICTTKPKFDNKNYLKDLSDLRVTAKKKGLEIEETTKGLLSLCETPGMKTKALLVKKHLDNKALVDLDPLPPGAKGYMKEAWLAEQGFINTSSGIGNNATKKGNLVEDGAISLLSRIDGICYTNEKDRVKEGFIGGTADIIDRANSKVIDIKCPESWVTFKSKKEIPSDYYWQLIAYCFLYKVTKAELVYVLMPDPMEIQEYYAKNLSGENFQKYINMNKKIGKLEPLQRVKRYSIDIKEIPKSIEFLEKRIEKCRKYYNTLTLKICLNL